MGLPCPNIFAGGHHFHGRYEYVPVASMIKATEVIIGIAQKVATQCIQKERDNLYNKTMLQRVLQEGLL